MLESLGALHALGQDVDFSPPLLRSRPACSAADVSLATQPFSLEPSRRLALVEEALTPLDEGSPAADGSLPDGLAPLDELFHTVSWERAPLLEPLLDAPSAPGAWLVFADHGGVGEALAARLEARGTLAHWCSARRRTAAPARIGFPRIQRAPSRSRA